VDRGRNKNMKKKITVVTLSTMLLALSFRAEGQTGKVPRVGYLTDGAGAVYLDVFRSGLREIGYVDGKNIRIESRSAEGNVARFNELVAELVNLNVDVIVTGGTGATTAASKATNLIPIITTVVTDPIASGFVASLARPGGNITGLTTMTAELSGKRLEILKETFPRVSTIAVLWNPENPGSGTQFQETLAAAQRLGIQVRSLEARAPDDIDKAFALISNKRADALVVIRGALTNNQQSRIIGLAGTNRLPAMYSLRAAVEAGGLMYYGVNDADLYRRAATYVDKILKGAKPANLPVEQPTKFEFVVNLKAAKAIGLTIPPNVLARADRVIR
jgi:putative ABC transport system substrate-binding protein